MKIKGEESKRRRLINKEKSNTWKQIRCWLEVGTVLFWMQQLSIKINLKMQIGYQTAHLLRGLFVRLWTVGHFILRAKRNRFNKLKGYLTKLAISFHSIWKIRRRVHSKQRLVTLLKKFEQSSVINLMMKLVLYKLRKLQIWFRRFIVKKRLLLSIMLLQWSYIEYAYRKSQASGLFNQNILERDIDNAIDEGRKSSYAPVQIRIHYITKYLKV